ncbi:MAG: hypothetical protein JWN00_2806, partial [Actinomycetia bacterium]|nr:hypothetical protein [Actinomycetes bacterium]
MIRETHEENSTMTQMMAETQSFNWLLG